ncbi:staphylolytic protease PREPROENZYME LASA [Pseudorhodobacter sp. E13]|uniref:EcsC family protein n=1 Tax=Pseudorhodobacter sp. E13 TaxID=2487931 RepID=UPI000F8E4307|nr:EcsC family protein [Pseudorhodobacter sp. E13]RUS58550.1 staphylolytic protease PREPROENZYME LASA [Pseudorhodobacter sp. E13]
MEDDVTHPLPAILPPTAGPEIAALAARQMRANGPLMRIINKFGGKIEDQMGHLPDGLRKQIERITSDALQRAVNLADHGRHAPDFGPRGAPALAALTGAVGGAGGLATALAELPVTITVILHAILRAAEEEGFDTRLPEVRAEALRVLSAGGPLAEDDGINTSFLGARMTLTGPALHKLLAKIVPGFASVLTQKLAAQAVPVLGAVTGAGLNTAFLTHYRELAHIRFGLLRLTVLHGAEPVRKAFEAELKLLKIAK